MSLFSELFLSIYGEIKNQSDNNYDNLLNISINLWCEKLNIPREIKDKSIYETIFLGKNGKEYNANELAIFYFNKLTEISNMKALTYVIFGLMVVGIGFIIYKFNSEQESSKSSQEKLFSNDSFTQLSPQKLILVVNSLKKSCLDEIKTNNKILNLDNCKKLYRSTSFLWMGSDDQLSSNFRNCNNYRVPSNEESEYDVYLVQIELPRFEKGFQKDADQIERSDAFRKLEGLKVKISDRLKVSVCENSNAYSH
jgi:hypothetical protein